MLKITSDAVNFESHLDPEFDKFITQELSGLRQRTKAFMAAQCSQLDVLRRDVAKDPRALDKLMLKERSRAAFQVTIRTLRADLERRFGVLGL
jgi:hypothetical protein